MVSQGTWSNGSSSLERKEEECLMSHFEWCYCEPREVTLDGIDWEDFPGRSYSKCANGLTGCGYFRWGCEPLGNRTEYILSKMHDEKLEAEEAKFQAESDLFRANMENMKLKEVMQDIDCKVNMLKRVVMGLSLIGLVFGVMMHSI